MRKGSGETAYFITDHLGSTNKLVDHTGAPLAGERQLYKPWGENRLSSLLTMTRYTYTGQARDSYINLYWMNSRWYDPALGRFVQPDQIVPLASQGTQAWDRYAYANNNSVRFNDPTGHWIESVFDIASICYDFYDISQNGLNWGSGLALAADIGGLLLPGVTGAGVAVRALTHVDEVADAARVVNTASNVAQTANQVENEVDLFRSMTIADNGLPALGETGRTLGVRPGITGDIPIDADGLVHPRTGGMSVSPESPMNLPPHRRPPSLSGTGKDPVWKINSSNLGPYLTYRPDPLNPTGHGFVEPTHSMPYDNFLQYLYNTVSSWDIFAH